MQVLLVLAHFCPFFFTNLRMAWTRDRTGHATPWLAGVCDRWCRLRRTAVREGGWLAADEPACPWKEDLLCGWLKLHTDARTKSIAISGCGSFLVPARISVNRSLPAVLGSAFGTPAAPSCTVSSSSTSTGSRLVLENIYFYLHSIIATYTFTSIYGIFWNEVFSKLTLNHSPVLSWWSAGRLVLA